MLIDPAEEIDTADFVSKSVLSTYATTNDLSTLVLKSALSDYATNQDAEGYITRAEAGQIVESHYDTYITNYNTMNNQYSTLNTKIGNIEDVLDEILAQ